MMPIIPSIHECAPNRTGIFETALLSFIASAPGDYEIVAVKSQAGGHLVQHCQLNLNNFHRTFRQCLHEGAAVGLGHDAVVEDDDDATIALCSDQAADTLAKF
jgi:hypothetical protein